MLLVLLDTGLRALELCALKVGDVDLKNEQVRVKHVIQGEPREARVSPCTAASLPDRLSGTSPPAARIEMTGAPLSCRKGWPRKRRGALLQLVRSCAKEVEVTNVYLCKLRHTFAITYLPSSCNVSTLQQILGHGSPDTVCHYA